MTLPPPPGQPHAAPGPVPAVPQQKWWHIPLLVGLGVLSTVFYIVIQFL